MTDAATAPDTTPQTPPPIPAEVADNPMLRAFYKVDEKPIDDRPRDEAGRFAAPTKEEPASEGEATPAPAAEAPPSSTPASPDQALLDRATAAGVEAELAKQMPPAVLERTVQIMEEAIQARASVRQPVSQEPPPPAAKEPEPPPAPKLDLDAILGDDREIAPSLAAAIKQVFAHGEERLEKLAEIVEKQAAELATLRDEAQTVRSNDFANTFDGWITELGQDWAGTFGAGTAGTLDRNGPQFQARVKLIDEMNVIRAGLEAQGKPVNHKEVFRKALRASFDSPKPPPATVPDKTVAEARKRAEGVVARPSGASPETSLDQSTMDAKYARAREILAKHGAL